MKDPVMFSLFLWQYAPAGFLNPFFSLSVAAAICDFIPFNARRSVKGQRRPALCFSCCSYGGKKISSPSTAIASIRIRRFVRFVKRYFSSGLNFRLFTNKWANECTKSPLANRAWWPVRSDWSPRIGAFTRLIRFKLCLFDTLITLENVRRLSKINLWISSLQKIVLKNNFESFSILSSIGLYWNETVYSISTLHFE